jgi:hypothetical protein
MELIYLTQDSDSCSHSIISVSSNSSVAATIEPVADFAASSSSAIQQQYEPSK